jgi:DNA-binding LacI/PurR family transcriptional regulator
LLDRSIGRGTFVKGQTPTAHTRTGRWLIVCDPGRQAWVLPRLLTEANPEAQIVTDVNELRPSFLKAFDGVIDLGQTTPETFLRDLAVRNIPFVAVNREPDVYSVNMVGTDRASGASFLTRDLILAGHTRLAVVRSLPRSAVPRAVELAAAHHGHGATTVTVCEVGDVVAAVQNGSTAIICDSVEIAREVSATLGAANIRTPDDVSLVAVGCCDDEFPCSGHYVDSGLLARSVVDMLRDNTHNGHRPTLLWMATRWIDRGTTRPLLRASGGEAA